MATIQSRVIRLVQDHLYYSEDERGAVVPTASFIDDLGADSLDVVELVMAAEEEFGVEIFDAEAEEIIFVADAVKLIERKTAPRSANVR